MLRVHRDGIGRGLDPLAGASGFTLIEMMAVMAVFVILAATALPLLKDSTDGVQLGIQARNVEREMQMARIAAVKGNQPVRLRFDCPAVGKYRIVELLGTPSAPASADNATNRCDGSVYPYPASDNDLLTRPNNDGAIQQLERYTAFVTPKTLEFWADGTAHADAGTGTLPWPMIPGEQGIAITVSRKGQTKSIWVNGLGKIKIE